MRINKKTIVWISIALFMIACGDMPTPEKQVTAEFVGVATTTKTLQLLSTSTPEPAATSTSVYKPTPAPTFTPLPIQTPSSTPTPDIVQTVVALSHPISHTTYLSPDGQWQTEIAIYDCVQVDEINANAYEVLKLVQINHRTKSVVDSQLRNCGGLGAYGLDGLFWSPDNHYFYYTNAREGVPDGCGYWKRPIIRLDVSSQQVEKLGGGVISPDGMKLATWQDRELVVWNINKDENFNKDEIGRASAAVQNANLGSIVWSPDSQSLVYLQVESYCPLSGKSYIVHLDLPEFRLDVLFESEIPTFGEVIWGDVGQIKMIDENKQEWEYNFVTKELKPTF